MSDERLYTEAEVAAREAATAEAMREACAKHADGWETTAAGDEYLTSGNGEFWDAGTDYAQGRHRAAEVIRALPIPHASALARALAAAEKRGMEKIAEKMATEIEEYLGEGHFVARFIRNAAAQEIKE